MDILYFVGIMSAFLGILVVKDWRTSKRKLRQNQESIDYFFRMNK